jgi:hypothetical protein
VCCFVAPTSVLFFLRRRFRRPRLILGDENGLDGGDHPFRSEEDMPPPDYQRIFPQTGMTLLSRIDRAWPRLTTAKIRATDAGRVMRQGQASAVILTPPPAMEDGQAEDDRVLQRNANDASILAWKGRQPEAGVVGKSADDVISRRLGLQEEP